MSLSNVLTVIEVFSVLGFGTITYLGNCNVKVQNYSLLLLLGFMFDSQQHSFEANRVIRELHHKEHSTAVVKNICFRNCYLREDSSNTFAKQTTNVLLLLLLRPSLSRGFFCQLL